MYDHERPDHVIAIGNLRATELKIQDDFDGECEEMVSDRRCEEKEEHRNLRAAEKHNRKLQRKMVKLQAAYSAVDEAITTAKSVRKKEMSELHLKKEEEKEKKTMDVKAMTKRHQKERQTMEAKLGAARLKCSVQMMKMLDAKKTEQKYRHAFNTKQSRRRALRTMLKKAKMIDVMELITDEGALIENDAEQLRRLTAMQKRKHRKASDNAAEDPTTEEEDEGDDEGDESTDTNSDLDIGGSKIASSSKVYICFILFLFIWNYIHEIYSTGNTCVIFCYVVNIEIN